MELYLTMNSAIANLISLFKQLFLPVTFLQNPPEESLNLMQFSDMHKIHKVMVNIRHYERV